MSFSSFRTALLERNLNNLFVEDDLFEPLDKLDREYYSKGDNVLIKLQSYLLEEKI